MNQKINMEDLPPDARAIIQGQAAVIPEKWGVYASIYLLLMPLSLKDAKWINNKIRRELERMEGGKGES